MVVDPLVTLAWASPVNAAPVTVAAVSRQSSRRWMPGSSRRSCRRARQTGMMAGVAARPGMVKSVVVGSVLKTCPVGPDGVPVAGIVTVSGLLDRIAIGVVKRRDPAPLVGDPDGTGRA